MNMGWDQVTAVAALVAFALLGVALLYGLVRLGQAIARWVGRAPKPSEASTSAVRRGPGALDPHVTAADLVAIRSNLLAVARQIEDLERRMRLSGMASPQATRLAPDVPSQPATAAR